MNDFVTWVCAQGALVKEPMCSFSKKNTLWALKGGPVNLLSVNGSKGAEVRRCLLSYLHPLFFSVALSSSVDLIAAYAQGVSIYELTEDTLFAALERDTALQALFYEEFHQWIEVMLSLLSPPIEQEPMLIDSTDVPMQQPFAFTRQADRTLGSWMEVIEGKLLLFGRDDLSFLPHGRSCPLTTHTWLVATEPSKVRMIDGRTLFQQSFGRRALVFAKELIGSLIIEMMQRQERQEMFMLQERHDEQQSNIDIALKRLEEVLIPAPLPPMKKTEDALKSALRILSSFIGVELVVPRSLSSTRDFEEQLVAICEASHVQKRQVLLEETWWKSDHGVLLGFYGPAQKAVVLRHHSFRGYEMIDAGGKVAVSRKIAEEISTTAYMFYLPLPEGLQSARQFFGFLLRKYRKSFGNIFFYSALGGLVSFFPPIVTKLLFTYALPESDQALIVYLTCGLVFVSVGFAWLYFLRYLLVLRVEGLSLHFLQSAIWDRLLSLPLPFFHRYSSGNLFWRLNATDEIKKVLSGNGANTLVTSIFSLFSLIIMWVYSPTLTAIALGFALCGLLFSVACAMKKVRIARPLLEIQGQIRGFLIQIISGIAKLRTSNAEKNAFAHWGSLFASGKSLELCSQRLQADATVCSASLQILTFWGIYGALLWQWETLPLSTFLAFNAGLGSFLATIYPLHNMLVQVCHLLPMWGRLKDILAETPETRKDKHIPGKLSGNVLVDSVEFLYDPGAPSVLHNITLEIKPHEFVAIVGPSGSGKSTLLRLVLGLEIPTAGGIYYDGKNLQALDPRSVRRQIGTVLQGDMLTTGSLYENLACGKSYTTAQVLHALHLAGFDRDFEQLAMGLNTHVPMYGETFSGGQKQRILLARALLLQPSILIFDEATSALDNQTQETIMESIASLNLSRIFIAQRLSTVKKADRIYVLENGRIVQTGSFAELARAPGLFADMLARQQLGRQSRETHKK